MNKYISRISTFNPWNPLLGLGRSLLAFCTLLTLCFNNVQLLIDDSQIQNSNFLPIKLNIYSLLSDHIYIAQIISIIILVTVILGFYPKITCLLHWWVVFSFRHIATTINGGDDIASTLTLLLIPICIFDRRKNHWRLNNNHEPNELINVFCYISYLFIKIQIAYIYADACLSKLVIDEWMNGTAIWYLAHHSIFGFIDFPFMRVILNNSIICLTLTYSVLVVEFLFMVSIFQKGVDKYKAILFLIGVLFHFVISIEIGIISFFFTMVAALLFLLIPIEKPTWNEKISNIFSSIKIKSII